MAKRKHRYEISPEEHAELEHMHTAGLMRKRMPEHVEASLIEKGYIYRGVGGHVMTHQGMAALFGK